MVVVPNRIGHHGQRAPQAVREAKSEPSAAIWRPEGLSRTHERAARAAISRRLPPRGDDLRQETTTRLPDRLGVHLTKTWGFPPRREDSSTPTSKHSTKHRKPSRPTESRDSQRRLRPAVTARRALTGEQGPPTSSDHDSLTERLQRGECSVQNPRQLTPSLHNVNSAKSAKC